MAEEFKKEYALDVNKLLVLNADYNQQVFISFVQDSSGNLKPQLEYRGKNKRAGENIKKSVSKLMSLKRTDRGVELFLGQERFAGFCMHEGQWVVDDKTPQEHLTAFEMRLLARPGNHANIPFSRRVVKSNVPITDLHNHFAGSPSPEGLVELGLKHDLSVPAWMIKELGVNPENLVQTEGGYSLKSVCQDEAIKSKFLEALRIPKEAQETFNKMEKIYAYRGMFTKNPKLMPDLLMLIGKELAEHGVKYTELSLSSIISDPSVLKMVTEEVPKVEQKTGCRIRFLGALWRKSDKPWNQDEVDRLKSVGKNPYVVGIDVMGHEANSTKTFGAEIKKVAEWAMENDPDFCIRVHAGENPLFRDNVKDVLKIMLQARRDYAKRKGLKKEQVKLPQIRIGHGLYGVDDETLDLCKKTGAIVEFNMSSNLALNNINFITEVPIAKYAQKGIPFVLGTDGEGIYSTLAEQEMFLAAAAGVSPEDFVKMRQTEDRIIATEAANFERKNAWMQKSLSNQSFEELFKPTFNTPTGEPRYSADFEKRKQKRRARLLRFLGAQLSRCHVETNPQKLDAVMAGKVPILISGASRKSWPDISPADQAEIKRTMELLVRVLDPEKVYILTGGTNHGVEKEMHVAAHARNSKAKKELAVIGTLTEAAAYKDMATIDPDTITHATILSDENGRSAKAWFDLPDIVLSHVDAKNGEVITIGGGGVVRDMIQRAYNLNMNLSLMDGPAGASTDEAKTMPECCFKTAEQLIEKIYARHPDIFIPGFDIEKLSKYGGKIKTPNGKKSTLCNRLLNLSLDHIVSNSKNAATKPH